MFSSIALHELLFFFSSRRRHTRWPRDWSSDVCSSDLYKPLQKETLYQLWEQEKRKFRLTSNQTSFGRERRWLQWLYLRKAHRETLPSLVYLPVQNELLMKSSRSEERRVGKECIAGEST